MKTNLIALSSFKNASLLALVMGALIFSGCRTMEGAGKDLENAAEGIQDAAK